MFLSIAGKGAMRRLENLCADYTLFMVYGKSKEIVYKLCITIVYFRMYMFYTVQVGDSQCSLYRTGWKDIC